MSRSNAPLALSVVNLTVVGDVGATVENLTRFDDAEFGFNHDQTWNAMPSALRGLLKPEAVAASFTKAPIRVQRCITALCTEGVSDPRQTLSFKDFPEARIRTVQSIDWDPTVRVRVKATCWYTTGGQVVIPVLQPRKDAVTGEQLSVYIRLVRQAYCRDEWVDARTEVYDLSGDEHTPRVRVIAEDQISPISDSELARWINTYVEAKRIADERRAQKEKPPATSPMDELLGLR